MPKTVKISDVVSLKKDEKNKSVTIDIFGIIGGWFDDETGAITNKEDLRAEIKAIEEIGNKVDDIHIRIDSPGGRIDHALAMYHALRQLPATKHTEYIAPSASAATVIGAASSKENTSMPAYMTLLIHEAAIPVFFATMTASVLDRESKELKTINEIAAGIYSNQTGLPVSDISEIMSTDGGEGMLLNAEKAKEFGFIGNITNQNKTATMPDPVMLKKAGWSEKNINKTNAIMGFFDKFKNADKPTLSATIKDGGIVAFKTLEVGDPVELLNSENKDFTGSFEHDKKNIVCEKGVITEVSEAEAISVDTAAISEEIKLMRISNEKTQTAFADILESVIKRIDSVEKQFIAAKKTASLDHLPDNSQQHTDIADADSKETMHEKLYRIQQEAKLSEKKGEKETVIKT